jgi:hypothetical protein
LKAALKSCWLSMRFIRVPLHSAFFLRQKALQFCKGSARPKAVSPLTPSSLQSETEVERTPGVVRSAEGHSVQGWEPVSL